MGDMREWWEKHAPRASKDLCVAPKKVAEVRDWLRSRVPSLRADHGNHGGGVVVGSGRVLLLTGPTGCGKSTAVELLCAELGLRLLRWSAPTPTLWHEHAYQGDLAAGYVSKQREFEEFLSRSTIMSQIPLGPSGSGGGGGGGLAFGKSVRAGGTVVLIDDLPATNGFQKHQELVDSLRRFCGSSRHPVVLCLSTIHKQDARDNQGYYQDRVVRSLELSTECKVCTFPAVTAPRIAKVLERASESENHYVDRQALSSIAESSTATSGTRSARFIPPRGGNEGGGRGGGEGKEEEEEEGGGGEEGRGGRRNGASAAVGGRGTVLQGPGAQQAPRLGQDPVQQEDRGGPARE